MRIRKNIMMTELGDDYVAIPVSGDKSFMIRMNETAAEIWRGIEDGLNEQQIADRLREKYDQVDNETALNSVRKVVEDLKQKGILEDN